MFHSSAQSVSYFIEQPDGFCRHATNEEYHLLDTETKIFIPVDSSKRLFKSFKDLHCYCAVDDSVSTVGYAYQQECKVTDSIIQNCAACDRVNWNDQLGSIVYNYKPGTEVRFAWGGTKPKVILNSSKSIDSIKLADLVIVATDGCIVSQDVEECQRLVGVLEDKIMICVLVTNSPDDKPSSVDVSVVLPFVVNATHAMILLKTFDSDNVKIIYTKGQFSTHFGKVDPSAYEANKHLPNFCQHNLQDMVFDTVNIPTGFRAFNEKFHLNQNFMNMSGDVDAFCTLFEQRQMFLEICKLRNSLGDLRRWLNLMKASLVHEEVKEVEQSPLDKEVASVLRSILRAETTDVERSDLRSKLQELRHKQLVERQQVKNETKEKKHDIRAMISEWQAAVTEMEKENYSANMLSSNRAQRAEKINVSFDHEKFIREFQSSENDFVLSECMICGEENTDGALMLYDGSSAHFTDNMCIDFPLAFGHTSTPVVSPAVFCTCCCTHFMQAGKDHYNSPIVACLPLYKYSVNANLWKKACSIALTERCVMPHSPLLLLAMCTHHLLFTEWVQANQDVTRALEYVCKSLAEGYMSYDDLNGQLCDGKKKPLTSVLPALTQEGFDRQPLSAVAVILYTILKQKMAQPTDQYREVMKRQLTIELIRQLNALHFQNNGKLEWALRLFQNEIFDAPFGIPLTNTAKLARFTPESAFVKLVLNYKDIENAMKPYLSITKLSMKDVMDDKTFTMTVYAVIAFIKRHRKLSNQIGNVEAIKLWGQCLNKSDEIKTSEICDIFNKLLPAKPRNDRNHDFFAYQTVLGPSVLQCSGCGYKFIQDTTKLEKKTDENMLLGREFHEKKKKHFMHVFHSKDEIPDRDSDASNMYVSTQRALSGLRLQKKRVTRQMLLEVLRFIFKNGMHGNYYFPEFIQGLIECIRSFVSVNYELNQNPEKQKLIPKDILLKKGCFISYKSFFFFEKAKFEYATQTSKEEIVQGIESVELEPGLTQPLTDQEILTIVQF